MGCTVKQLVRSLHLQHLKQDSPQTSPDDRIPYLDSKLPRMVVVGHQEVKNITQNPLKKRLLQQRVPFQASLPSKEGQKPLDPRRDSLPGLKGCAQHPIETFHYIDINMHRFRKGAGNNEDNHFPTTAHLKTLSSAR